MSVISKVPSEGCGASSQNSVSEAVHWERLYDDAVRRLKCLSYLPQILADKEYENQRNKELLAQKEASYHQLHSQYINLLRTIPYGDLCSTCGQQIDKRNSSTNYDHKLRTSPDKSQSRYYYPLTSQHPVTNKLSTDGECSKTIISNSHLFDIPEVSKKNFDSLMEENARLKSAVIKLKKKGVDVEHFLTVQEYENVIAGLREQIRHLTLELEEIKYINNIIAQKDKSFLAKTCKDLKKQVSLLELGIKNKDKMITQLIDVIKKHKQEFPADVVQQSGTTSSTDIPQTNEDVTFVKEDQTQQIYENKISALEQEIAEMRISLAKVMEDKAKLDGSHQDLLATYENLLSQTMAEPRECPESYRQLMCEKKCLQDAYNTLKHDMRKVLDEKQLLIEQCKTFSEDYRQEQSNHKSEKEELLKQINQLKEKKHLPQKWLASTSLSGFDSGYGSSQSVSIDKVLTCERCQQTFQGYDQIQYEEHVKKCQAD